MVVVFSTVQLVYSTYNLEKSGGGKICLAIYYGKQYDVHVLAL